MPAPAAGSSGVHAAEVDPADEGGTAVDDQQLAVVAVVDQPSSLRRQRIDRVELEDLHAACPQAIEEGLWRTDGADAVVDQVDLHALRALLQQELGKLPADFVVLDDVALEVDVIGGGADRGKHRRVGRRAVLEQEHAVARRERGADDGLLGGDMLLEDVQVTRIAIQACKDGRHALRGERSPGAVDLHARGIARSRSRVRRRATARTPAASSQPVSGQEAFHRRNRCCSRNLRTGRNHLLLPNRTLCALAHHPPEACNGWQASGPPSPPDFLCAQRTFASAHME